MRGIEGFEKALSKAMDYAFQGATFKILTVSTSQHKAFLYAYGRQNWDFLCAVETDYITYDLTPIPRSEVIRLIQKGFLYS